MKITPANGVKGFILGTGYDTPTFRVYTRDEQGDIIGFVDYDLWHPDLEVTIVDESASLFEREDGVTYLDISPDAMEVKE